MGKSHSRPVARASGIEPEKGSTQSAPPELRQANKKSSMTVDERPRQMSLLCPSSASTAEARPIDDQVLNSLSVRCYSVSARARPFASELRSSGAASSQSVSQQPANKRWTSFRRFKSAMRMSVDEEDELSGRPFRSKKSSTSTTNCAVAASFSLVPIPGEVQIAISEHRKLATKQQATMLPVREADRLGGMPDDEVEELDERDVFNNENEDPKISAIGLPAGAMELTRKRGLSVIEPPGGMDSRQQRQSPLIRPNQLPINQDGDEAGHSNRRKSGAFFNEEVTSEVIHRILQQFPFPSPKQSPRQSPHMTRKHSLMTAQPGAGLRREALQRSTDAALSVQISKSVSPTGPSPAAAPRDIGAAISMPESPQPSSSLLSTSTPQRKNSLPTPASVCVKRSLSFRERVKIGLRQQQSHADSHGVCRINGSRFSRQRATTPKREELPQITQLLHKMVMNSVDAMACTALPTEFWLRERLSHFCQLSGHQGNIVPATDSTLWKKTGSRDNPEAVAYRHMQADAHIHSLVPQFSQAVEFKGEHFIEIEDLQRHFNNPAIMDIKMGKRTFVEAEVKNSALRGDLYGKMIKINLNEPTEEEHAAQAITKLRYMQFRDRQSSTFSYGFRIEAVKTRTNDSRKNFQKVRTKEQITRALADFVERNGAVRKAFVARLKEMRHAMQKSHFFRSHELIGSSLLFLFDDECVGIWMIDFAKVSECPVDCRPLSHRAGWLVGNHEDGYLAGLDNLITMFEETKL